MSAISGAIPNLVGGTSQQPPEIRPVNTAKRLLNSVCDVATGLYMRPASQYVADISAKPTGSNTVASHLIQKPSGNYRVTIHGGSIFVTDLTTGINRPVTVQGTAAAYINVVDASKYLRFLTIGDTTFVYNTSKICTATQTSESGITGLTEGGVVRRSPNRHSTFWVRQRAGYNANYAIYYNGTREALVTTDTLTPTVIATNLAAAMTTRSITEVSNTVRSIQLSADSDYINAADDLAGEAIYAFNDSVTEFTKLPNFDRNGRLVLIRQSDETTDDDYWVWYKGGRWQETYGWGAYEKPNADSMPHILVDNRDGTWTIKPHVWPGRTVGDKDSNPTPTFIGRTINSMFLYKGRMVILTDENFLASQVGNYENFYRSSCTQLLDDDCIDIASPNSRGAKLIFGVEFSEKLILSSQFDQFVVDGNSEGLFSPNTVTIKRVNSYTAADGVDPVFVGPNFIFVDDFQNGGYANMKEYQTERVFGRQVALSITDQVPEYIPSGVYKMASSSSDDILVVLSKNLRSSLWLYNYYYNNDGKVQASWQEWQFPFDIHAADFLDDLLLLTVSHDTDLYVVSVSFSSGADNVLDNESVLLDLRVHSDTLSVAYAGGNTTVTLPWDVKDAAEFASIVAVVSPVNTGTMRKGLILKPYSYSGGVLTFRNVNLTGQKVLFGIKYKFRWELNPIYVRDKNLVAIQDGRLQLRNISFLYNNSGPFKVYVTPEGRDTYEDPFTGIIVGSSSNPLGSLTLSSGEFRTAAYGESTTMSVVVEAEGPWRVRFSSLEWDGAYRARKQRTT